MTAVGLNPVVGTSIERDYLRRTPRSADLHARARQWIPSGDTRSATWFAPYPTYMARGAGCRLVDVDGNEYLDFLGNYTSLIHGHAHPAVTAALVGQAQLGAVHGAPTEAQVRLAEILCSRVASLEQIRFCNSGTEATLFAIRAARAFTGRNKILKMEGGFHGTHDAVQISVSPSLDEAGPDEAPLPVAASAGLGRRAAEDVLVATYNDVASTLRIIEQNAADLAAVIVEPVLGSTGVIPGDREFLRSLRHATEASGALLILDEIITLRLGYGGAQEALGLRPDLTTMGKIMGGGLPVGAFGGRAEVMALFAPEAGRMPHSGTFNGNAATMAAGVAAMELLPAQEIERLNALGERLRQGLRDAFHAAGIAGQVTGAGSLAGIHFTAEPVTNYRSAARADAGLRRFAHIGLLNHGVFAGPRCLLCTSTVMREEDVEHAVDAFRAVLGSIRNHSA